MNIHRTVEIALHAGSTHSEGARKTRKARSVPEANGDLEPDEQQALTSWEDRMFFDQRQVIDGVFSAPQPKIQPPTRLELVRQELDRRLGDIKMKFLQSLIPASPEQKAKEYSGDVKKEPTPEGEEVRAAFAKLESVPPEARLLAFLGVFTGDDGF